ncbi:MAG: metallophosphoesterase family protein [Planctomycetes bacterium]|nr:metallophosphoesterase family protein [Planctomycetota bacterium]
MREIFNIIPHACFVGHTHVPGVFLEDLSFTKPSDLWAGNYFIEQGEKVLINIGSVGQPRDGDTRSSYVIIDNDDPNSVTVQFRRVEYDIEETATAIEDNPHLDNYLAERLRHGR